MRARLLQKVTFFPEPNKELSGIVTEIGLKKEFRGIQLAGNEPIEVYTIYCDNKQKRYIISFLEIEKVCDTDVNELLTHSSFTIRLAGLAKKEHPKELKNYLRKCRTNNFQSIKPFLYSFAEYEDASHRLTRSPKGHDKA